jgi:NAD+-dependent protein deacetylase sirtuin 6
MREGPVRYIVSQNVDSLHRRSGVPEAELSEVHGNCFMERCPSCNKYYLRDFEMPSVGFQLTGRSCVQKRCRCALLSNTLFIIGAFSLARKVCCKPPVIRKSMLSERGAC